MEIAFRAILRFAKASVNASQGLMLFDKGDGSSAKTFFWNFEICFLQSFYSLVLFLQKYSALSFLFFSLILPPTLLAFIFLFLLFCKAAKMMEKTVSRGSFDETSQKTTKGANHMKRGSSFPYFWPEKVTSLCKRRARADRNWTLRLPGWSHTCIPLSQHQDPKSCRI